MIKESDIVLNGTEGVKGVALVWVIDGRCLYDIPIYSQYEDLFVNSTSADDVSSEYPDHDGIVVRFTKYDGSVIDFATSEYFGSILTSNPRVLNLSQYPYGRYVVSPDAEFDGEKFIILNRDTTDLMPWYS